MVGLVDFCCDEQMQKRMKFQLFMGSPMHKFLVFLMVLAGILALFFFFLAMNNYQTVWVSSSVLLLASMLMAALEIAAILIMMKRYKWTYPHRENEYLVLNMRDHKLVYSYDGYPTDQEDQNLNYLHKQNRVQDHFAMEFDLQPDQVQVQNIRGVSKVALHDHDQGLVVLYDSYSPELAHMILEYKEQQHALNDHEKEYLQQWKDEEKQQLDQQ